MPTGEMRLLKLVRHARMCAFGHARRHASTHARGGRTCKSWASFVSAGAPSFECWPVILFHHLAFFVR